MNEDRRNRDEDRKQAEEDKYQNRLFQVLSQSGGEWVDPRTGQKYTIPGEAGRQQSTSGGSL